MTCEFCGQPVLESDVAAFPVTGWEIERVQGGANHIRLRQRLPDRIAHGDCVREAAAAARAGTSWRRDLRAAG